MAKTYWRNVDGLVIGGVGKLLSITLVADGVGAADCTVYDGLNTSGEKILTLSTPTSSSQTVTFGDGRDIGSGLYLDVGSNVTGVLLVLA